MKRRVTASGKPSKTKQGRTPKSKGRTASAPEIDAPNVERLKIIFGRHEARKQATIAMWAEPEKWPTAPFRYVFIAEAVDQIGKKMFAVNWNLAHAAKAWINGTKNENQTSFDRVLGFVVEHWEARFLEVRSWPKRGGMATSISDDALFWLSPLDDIKRPRNPRIAIAWCSLDDSSWLCVEQVSLQGRLKSLSAASTRATRAGALTGAVNAIASLWPNGITTVPRATKPRDSKIQEEWRRQTGSAKKDTPSPRTYSARD